MIPGRRQTHQAEGGLQRKGVLTGVDRAQDSGLGCPVRQALLIETKPREFEQHHQQANDGDLPLGAALQLFIFGESRRDVVLPIERNHAAVSAREPTGGGGTRNAEALKDPRVACLADNLSNPMVVATTALEELRHGPVSGTPG